MKLPLQLKLVVGLLGGPAAAVVMAIGHHWVEGLCLLVVGMVLIVQLLVSGQGCCALAAQGEVPAAICCHLQAVAVLSGVLEASPGQCQLL